ncbi:hypothetical protein QJQ45_022152 [Haematococcus lacustris]|nr:hypothetical protein QJQ45_022152 [Haematococcus lacustris]
MQRIGESKWRPLELCFWPEQGALPAKGKEYPGLGYERVRDKPPKAQQQQQPAVAQARPALRHRKHAQQAQLPGHNLADRIAIMEELKKLKASMQALFSGEKAEGIKWKDKGKARTLGSAEEAAKPRLSAAAQQPERPPVPSHAARPAVPAQPMQSPEERASRQRASSRASGPAGPPPPLSTVGSMRADEPQRGLLSGVVMANTPTVPAVLLNAPKCLQRLQCSSVQSTACSPCSAHRALPPLDCCVALLCTWDRAAPALHPLLCMHLLQLCMHLLQLCLRGVAGRERRGLGSHLSVGVVPAGMDSSNNSMGAAGQAVHCRPGDTGWATASTARHGTAQHSTAQHSTARHGTARHGTARHDTAQHLSEDAGPHAALIASARSFRCGHHPCTSGYRQGMVASGAMNTPTKGERALGLGGCPVPSHDDSFHMQQCMALILSHTTQPAARQTTPAGQQPIQGPDQGTQAGGSQEAGQQAATERPAASETLAALARILRNILLQPAEPKYRSIRLSNPKVAAGITAVPGAMELLEGCGFQLHFKQHSGVQHTGAAADPPATGADEGFLVLPEAAPLAPLTHCYQELGKALAGSGLPPLEALPAAAWEFSATPSYTTGTSQPPGGSKLSAQGGGPGSATLTLPGPASATEPARGASGGGGSAGAAGAVVAPGAVAGGGSGKSRLGPSAQQGSSQGGPTPAVASAAVAHVDRATKVVLPVAPDMAPPPDWFFERTGAEVKSEWNSLAQRRTAGEVLTTRAWRERAAAAAATSTAAPGSAGSGSRVATLRVRFPEGVCLQGCFAAQEPVTAVWEWVTQALRVSVRVSTRTSCTISVSISVSINVRAIVSTSFSVSTSISIKLPPGRPQYGELQYELITPARRPLPAAGCVRDVPDLLPAAVLNFRLLDSAGRDLSRMPMLSDSMLALTTTE